MGKRKKTQQVLKSSKQNDIYFFIGYLTLIILHILGGFWHSYYCWGISYLAVFSHTTIVLTAIISIVILLNLYFFRGRINLSFLTINQLPEVSKLNSVLLYTVLSLSLFFILYIFRSQVYAYGDGFMIIGNTLSLENIFADPKNFMELLTIYLYFFAASIAKYFDYYATAEILGLLTSLAGVFGFWAIWNISASLSETKEKKTFLFISSLTSATIILFFGYIENYTIAFVLALWSLKFSIGYVKHKNSFIPVLLFSILAIGFHLITLPFLLVGVYAMLLRNKNTLLNHINPYSSLVIVILGAIGVMLLAQLNAITVFVPLWEIPNNLYTLFSIGHFSDVLNQLLLVAPLIVVLLVSQLFQFKMKFVLDESEKLLFLASFFTMLTAILVNPELGALRDWDLFSLYGIPLTLLIGSVISKQYNDKSSLNWLILASLLIALVHIGPNLYEKNHREKAIEFMDKVIWDDPHYQESYFDAYRCRFWGVILNQSNHKELATKYFTKRLNAHKYDSKSLYNLGLLQIDKKQLDSARYYLQKAIQLSPQAAQYLSMLSKIEILSGNDSLAEIYSRESIGLDSNHVFGLMMLGAVLNSQDNTEEAFYYFRKAYKLDSISFANINNLAVVYFDKEDYDSAFYYFKRALPLATVNKKIETLGDLITLALKLNMKKEAIEYLDELKLITPDSKLISEKQKEIYGE